MKNIIEQVDQLAEDKRNYRESASRTWDTFVEQVTQLREHAAARGVKVSYTAPIKLDEDLVVDITGDQVVVIVPKMVGQYCYRRGAPGMLRANYGGKDQNIAADNGLAEVMDQVAVAISLLP